ncbi:carboxylesterase [Colletotrichum karsti]|uniref:Carboxylic ester hydrolase n=1 Tax=Colletotrichum karsti TaxID=1095194 RepID=A0A9P6IER0_9PEZI|nr:carboxylesterase [Colletotrichum karsti]KAF9879156.1 carboxylesterase [Colletotrichum karsti]
MASPTFIPWLLFTLLQTTAAALSSQPPFSQTPNTPPLVTIKNGTLAGAHNPSYNQDFFLGIPFASPPLADLRLRRPAPSKPWPGFTRLADEYGPWCIGNVLPVPGLTQPAKHREDEDCLHLNIIRPSPSPGPAPVPVPVPMPVLVWIHGGGFQDGSAVDPRYNGSFLVRESVAMGTPVIFVSINYRLGVFGMMYGAAVEAEAGTNLLLHDQRRALLWIRENIADFGGDPSRVTIAGQSAGGFSVGHHLTGRDDALFSGAIAQSGPPFSTTPPMTPAEKEAHFDTILNITGCPRGAAAMSCLRTTPASLLQRAGLLLGYSDAVTIDADDILTNSSYNLLRAGAFVKVPLLIGTTRNEATSILQFAMPGPLNTFADFAGIGAAASNGGKPLPEELVRRWFALYGDEIDHPSPAGLGTVLAHPGPELGAEYGRTALFVGDAMFNAGKRFAARAWAERGVDCYSYFFDTVPAHVDAETMGATHFMEIPFVFGNKEGAGWEVDPFPEDAGMRRRFEDLAEVMSRMWISFVVYGSPNHHRRKFTPNPLEPIAQLADILRLVLGGNVTWPPYSREEPMEFVFSAVKGASLQADTWREEAIQMFFDLAEEVNRP